MLNYEMNFIKSSILLVACLAQYLPLSKADEPTVEANNNSASLNSEDSMQAKIMQEEFFLFLANFDNEGGVIMDPLDMISIDLDSDKMPEIDALNKLIPVNDKQLPNGNIPLKLNPPKENK